jgi:hypothetical protein
VHDQPTTAESDYAWPTCTACIRPLRHDELGRTSCRLCQDRADHALQQLPGPDGLYAQLATRLAPGRGGDSIVVTASRTAPLPLVLDVLNLQTEKGPVLGKLEPWVRDWERFGRAEVEESGTLQQRVDHAVRTLRFNLAWAAAEHPAFGDFLQEVGNLVGQCERKITGERKERPISVACPCGTVLRITVSTPGKRCGGCNTQYDRGEILDLPLANRAAA